MCSQYEALVTALKALTQGEAPNTETLPMAENEWYTRPDSESYGTVALDFEAGAIRGDNQKMDTSYEGSVDLFSMSRDGDGAVEAVVEILEEVCGPCWSLNSHVWEQGTRLFHWEWTFEVDDAVHSEDDGDEGSPGNAGSNG